MSKTANQVVAAATPNRGRFFVKETDLLSRLGGPAFSAHDLEIGEARRQRALPAVSTILASLLQRGLERQNREPFFGTLMSKLRKRDESAESFVMKRFQEHARETADAERFAEAMFNACERWSRTGRFPLDKTRPGVTAFGDFFKTHDLKVIASREVLRGVDYAGQVDFVAEQGESGDEFLLDLRLGRTALPGQFEFFIGMGVELAAKALARERSTGRRPRIATLGISTDEPGRLEVRWWSLEEQDQFARMFQAAKELWKTQSGFGIKRAAKRVVAA